MHRARKQAFVSYVSACPSFSLSLKTDYVFAMFVCPLVYFMNPFGPRSLWDFCLNQVMYHVVLLLRRGLHDLKFQTSANLTKSEICFAFAFLPCLFEPVYG